MHLVLKRQNQRPALRHLRATTVGVLAVAIWFASSAIFGPIVAGAGLTPASVPAGPAARVGTVPSIPNGATIPTPLPTTTTLHIDVVLQPRDPAALAQFATEVSTPGSPLYRQYLA